MTANVEAMVREGIRAYRAGKKAEARALLEKAVEADSYHEQAWLWLSAVVESPEEQRTCLNNVLIINPDNENAKQGLAMLESPEAASQAATASAPDQEDDPFADLDFSSATAFDTSLPAQSSSPFGDTLDEGAASSAAESTGNEDFKAPPTATSSASSTYNPADEPTADVYDDWVSDLGLGNSSADSDSSAIPNTIPASSFDREGLLDNDSFDDSLLEDEDESSVSGPFSAPTTNALDETSPPPAQPTSSSLTSPGYESPADDGLLDEIDTLSLSGGDLIVEDYDEMEIDVDPAEYFQYLPDNIKATRLPGTTESYPPLVLVGLIVLVILNMGAIGLLLSKIAG